MQIKKIIDGATIGAKLAAGPEGWALLKSGLKTVWTAFSVILTFMFLTLVVLWLTSATSHTAEDVAWCRAHQHELTTKQADACQQIVNEVEGRE